jgi:hypothetical protein
MSVHTISVALQRAFSHVPSNFIQKFSAQLAKTGSIAVRGDDRGLENLVAHIRQSQTTWIRLMTPMGKFYGPILFPRPQSWRSQLQQPIKPQRRLGTA